MTQHPLSSEKLREIIAGCERIAPAPSVFGGVVRERNALQSRLREVEEALREIVDCTHSPNPTDLSRIDVRPGQHRRFQAAIQKAAALNEKTEG